MNLMDGKSDEDNTATPEPNDNSLLESYAAFYGCAISRSSFRPSTEATLSGAS